MKKCDKKVKPEQRDQIANGIRVNLCARGNDVQTEQRLNLIPGFSAAGI